jgi:DNA-directed RNA polymerase subunit RPC12/RpoP
MKVSRLQVVARGLRNRCPNCGGKTLFREGTLFQTNSACPSCGLKIERDEGFFIGSMSINYGVTLCLFLTPLMILAYKGVIGTTPAIVIAGVGALGFPVLFYRSSRSWWLMQYYLLFPLHLPANKAGAPAQGEDENH